MSDFLKKIELLEQEIALLTEERRFAMSTLEIAANLLVFDSGPSNFESHEMILEETSGKILSMLDFEGTCFYLINEEDSSFQPAYCEPEEMLPEFEKMVDQLIENQTFAWALGRNKAVRVDIKNSSRPLLLHALSTASRTRGMFIGLPIESEDEFESPLPLLSLILHSCANILESFELYRRMRQTNQSLEQKNQELQQRSNDLQLAHLKIKQADAEKNLSIQVLQQKFVQKLNDFLQETDQLTTPDSSPDQHEYAAKCKQRIQQLLSDINLTTK